MTLVKVDYKNIYYPPGGILIWIIIFLELITFAAVLIAMEVYGQLERELFHESRLLLNPTFGMLNTIFLVTSGFFMALSVNVLKRNQLRKFNKYLGFTAFFGLLFLVLKSIEYTDKIAEGLTIGYNTFFTFYWMLTLFHVIHVIVGLVILSTVYFGIRKKDSDTKLEDVEASAAFWHMCDLIWILLFPILYLVF